MSQPKRIDLNATTVSLLTASARELIPELAADSTLREVRGLAFLHWDTMRKEEVQVHVVVTRDTTEFIEPFQTVETR